MRTTVNLDPDVQRAVDQLRRERHIGVSEAVNDLARRGLAAAQPARAFRQSVSAMGPRVPLDDVGAALETLEGDTHR
jgi:predicted transcriptional regulator